MLSDTETEREECYQFFPPMLAVVRVCRCSVEPVARLVRLTEPTLQLQPAFVRARRCFQWASPAFPRPVPGLRLTKAAPGDAGAGLQIGGLASARPGLADETPPLANERPAVVGGKAGFVSTRAKLVNRMPAIVSAGTTLASETPGLPAANTYFTAGCAVVTGAGLGVWPGYLLARSAWMSPAPARPTLAASPVLL